MVVKRGRPPVPDTERKKLRTIKIADLPQDDYALILNKLTPEERRNILLQEAQKKQSSGYTEL